MRVVDRAALVAVERDRALEGAVVRVEALLCDEQRIGAHALLGHEAGHARGHQGGDAAAHADIDHEVCRRAVARDAQDFVPDAPVGIVLRRHAVNAFGAQGLGQQRLSELAGFGLGRILEVGANLERARPVFTKLSQAGLGVEVSEVMICTTSPLLSSVRSGTSSSLILAAVVRCPILLWMA